MRNQTETERTSISELYYRIGKTVNWAARYDNRRINTRLSRFKGKLKGETMAENVYKVIELVGTSSESGKKQPQLPSSAPVKTLRDLRIAEVVEPILQLTTVRWKPTGQR